MWRIRNYVGSCFWVEFTDFFYLTQVRCSPKVCICGELEIRREIRGTAWSKITHYKMFIGVNPWPGLCTIANRDEVNRISTVVAQAFGGQSQVSSALTTRGAARVGPSVNNTTVAVNTQRYVLDASHLVPAKPNIFYYLGTQQIDLMIYRFSGSYFFRIPPPPSQMMSKFRGQMLTWSSTLQVLMQQWPTIL